MNRSMIRRISMPLFVAAVLSQPILTGFSQDRYSKVRIPISSQEEVATVSLLGLDVEGGLDGSGRWIDLIVSEREVRQLRDNGIPFTTLISDWQKYYNDRQRLEKLAGVAFPKLSAVKNFHLGSMGGVLTIDELAADLDLMHSKYPDLITAKDSIGTTCENRPIWAARISRNPGGISTPQALYLGLHHACEPISMMVLTYFMWYLLENYGSDPEVTQLLENRELYFVPMVNPDGYHRNEMTSPTGGGLWRKNTRQNLGMSMGVDLNRNYGFKWGFDDLGSSPQWESQSYRGTAPFSEPETQAIRDFVIGHHFTIAISYHAFLDYVFQPWSYSFRETSDSALFQRMEEQMTKVNHYVFGSPIWYACNGEATDWMYGDVESKGKIYAMTAEVGTSEDGFWPPSSRILPLVMENLRANLITAHAAGNYILIDRPRVTYKFQHDSVQISVPFINCGALATATTMDVKVSSSDLVIDSLQYRGMAWLSSRPLVIRARSNRVVGTKVALTIEGDYGGGRLIDTLVFRLGPATVLYDDDAEITRSRWSAQSWTLPWDTSDVKAHSGRLSFLTPRAPYGDSINSLFTLDSTLLLSGSAAELKFWITGSTAQEWQGLWVEISADGGAPVPLQGLYTHPAVGNSAQTPAGSPVLSGNINGWVEELMDLTPYIGRSVRLRFRFASDIQSTYEGFYIDDIRILTYPLTTGISGVRSITPIRYELSQNYPNPFNPTTTILYEIPKSSIVSLKIFNTLGQEITSLVNGRKEAGYYQVMWKASNLPSGIYFYRLQAGACVETKKMILMR